MSSSGEGVGVVGLGGGGLSVTRPLRRALLFSVGSGVKEPLVLLFEDKQERGNNNRTWEV